MTNHEDQINNLVNKQNILLKKQENFLQEINELRIEINKLKIATATGLTEIKEEIVERIIPVEIKKEEAVIQPPTPSDEIIKNPVTQPVGSRPNKPKEIKSDLEKFIGENLINKIGIVITIIGVAIGAKYSIEHDLISPLTRIVLGYITGGVLLGFGMKLRKQYENYSSVLVSGAIAIMYFITYAAYSFYGLFPQLVAFGLMVVFTAFTVLAALSYNRQIIAIIGLVGAYAVPFLLSDGSGKIVILFTYMTIINVGIMVIAFNRYWKPLYYSAFGLSWLIYIVWYTTKYTTSEHYSIAAIFLSVFFVIFYSSFLCYKLLQKEKFEIDDVILLLINSFIFFGIGYEILGTNAIGKQFQGLFALFNAIIHFFVSAIIYRQQLSDKNLFYLITGLVLVFVTITIPIQLNGKWVTTLWAAEAALLFWIGKTKQATVYESLSYPLMLLAFGSIIDDWVTIHEGYSILDTKNKILPLLNVNFLSSIFFVSLFGVITYINQNKKYASILNAEYEISKVISYSIPTIFLFTLYYTFRLEIETYWHQLYLDSSISVKPDDSQMLTTTYRNNDLRLFKSTWVINYSLLFVSIISLINLRVIKNKIIGVASMGLNTFVIIIFLTQGLYLLSELRESYLAQPLDKYYQVNVFHIIFRYVSFVFVSISLYSCYKSSRTDFLKQEFKKGYNLLLHISILWIASSELINWMDITGSEQSYKLGLSILWGLYSLILISYGIWKNEKHIRLGAIALFAITLLKLFFYDISHLNTISKTVVLVSLGILMLVISFLYNKYTHIITDEIEN